MRDKCCAARGSQQHMPEQLWHSDAATVPGSSRLKAASKRKLLTHARVSIQHGSGHRSAQFASCAAQSSAARTARPGAPFAQKVTALLWRAPQLKRYPAPEGASTCRHAQRMKFFNRWPRGQFHKQGEAVANIRAFLACSSFLP